MAQIGYIQVTRYCNQNCRFCSNPPFEKNIDIDEIPVLLKEYKEDGFESVIFSGGEPTLYDKLPQAISIAREIGLIPRVITNGQKTSDIEYFKTLVQSGLKYIIISVHSHEEKTQNFLSGNKQSFENLRKTLENSGQLDIEVNTITVINAYNEKTLDKTVKWIVDNFENINHIVINNMDPFMNRAHENPDVIPSLINFELPLWQAMHFLHAKGKSFRVERVPLCYMADFAHCSTEARKIIKKESRTTHFLDDKGIIQQTEWHYPKSDDCSNCSYNTICAGLYSGGEHYCLSDLYPVFLNKDKVVKKVLIGY